ncbi:MAG: hypothetical protein K2M17_00330 [Bacilli bacterium]|nr:hypothetical protein [Bacilli bacterium]
MSDKGFKVEVKNLSNLKELLDTASRQTSDLIGTLEKINDFNFETEDTNKKADLSKSTEVAEKVKAEMQKTFDELNSSFGEV